MIGAFDLIRNRINDEDRIKAAKAIVGQPVVSATVNDRDLVFIFANGVKIILHDEHSCCEDRYFSTDDDLGCLVGGLLLSMEVADMGTTEDEYGDDHEQRALKIQGTTGFVTVVCHNKHNGYYGGMRLRIGVTLPPHMADDAPSF